MLTERQAAVLEFVKTYAERYRMPPTRFEIAQHFGWASLNAAEGHLRALRDKGRLEFLPGRARGLRIIGD